MKSIKNLIDSIEEELEGAKDYAERALEEKVRGNTTVANHFHEMAQDELKHSGFLHELAVKSADDLSKVFTPPEEMLEEEGGYSEARGGRGHGGRSYMEGSSYDDDMMYSERRDRGRNARRDSMGRYSSEDGSSYEDYSEESGSSYRGGYSRGSAKEHMMNKLGTMMEDADPKEREALKKCMRAIEEA